MRILFRRSHHSRVRIASLFIGLLLFVVTPITVVTILTPIQPALAISDSVQSDKNTDTKNDPEAANKAKTEAAVAAAQPNGPDLMDRIMLYLAGLGISFAAILSKLIVTVMEMMMPILLYNNFANNPVVDAGWAILRDTVNMFFVVLLIAIAFGTIFGAKRFQWQQQMVRLLGTAILINFSRTICGLIIDAGQVVTLTFANAIREVAAGNFVNMFGLGDIYSISTNNSMVQEATKDATASAPKAFDYFASAIAAIFMCGVVLVVLLALMLVFLYRIVMLWILITVSPLTWFFGATAGIIKTSAYDDWWKEFNCLVLVGPVLTFFLWLTLVVAGSGGGELAANAGFDVASGTAVNTAGGFVSSIFELPKLISFVIAIGLLWAGMDAAQKMCTNMRLIGNPAGFVKKAADKSAMAMRGFAVRGAAKTARVAGGAIKSGVGAVYRASTLEDTVSRAKENMARGVGNSNLPMTDGMRRAAFKKADQVKGGRASILAAAGAKFKDDSTETISKMLSDRAEKPELTTQGRQDSMALMLQAMKDPQLMQHLQMTGAWDKLMARHGKDLDLAAKDDKNVKKVLDAYKKSNPASEKDWVDAKKNPKGARDQLAALSTFALAGEGVRERAASMSSGVNKPKAMWADKNVPEQYNMLEMFENGKVGTDEQRNALLNGMAGIYADMKPADQAKVSPVMLAQNVSPQLLSSPLGEQLMQNKDATVQETLYKTVHRKNADGTYKNPAARGELLKKMGVEGGSVKNAEAFLKSLNQNPGSLAHLTPEELKRIREEGYEGTKTLNLHELQMKADPQYMTKLSEEDQKATQTKLKQAQASVSASKTLESMFTDEKKVGSMASQIASAGSQSEFAKSLRANVEGGFAAGPARDYASTNKPASGASATSAAMATNSHMFSSRMSAIDSRGAGGSEAVVSAGAAGTSISLAADVASAAMEASRARNESGTASEAPSLADEMKANDDEAREVAVSAEDRREEMRREADERRSAAAQAQWERLQQERKIEAENKSRREQEAAKEAAAREAIAAQEAAVRKANAEDRAAYIKSSVEKMSPREKEVASANGLSAEEFVDMSGLETYAMMRGLNREEAGEYKKIRAEESSGKPRLEPKTTEEFESYEVDNFDRLAKQTQEKNSVPITPDIRPYVPDMSNAEFDNYVATNTLRPLTKEEAYQKILDSNPEYKELALRRLAKGAWVTDEQDPNKLALLRRIHPTLMTRGEYEAKITQIDDLAKKRTTQAVVDKINAQGGGGRPSKT